jgi:hypothetical protein
VVVPYGLSIGMLAVILLFSLLFSSLFFVAPWPGCQMQIACRPRMTTLPAKTEYFMEIFS